MKKKSIRFLFDKSKDKVGEGFDAFLFGMGGMNTAGVTHYICCFYWKYLTCNIKGLQDVLSFQHNWIIADTRYIFVVWLALTL